MYGPDPTETEIITRMGSNRVDGWIDPQVRSEEAINHGRGRYWEGTREDETND